MTVPNNVIPVTPGVGDNVGAQKVGTTYYPAGLLVDVSGNIIESVAARASSSDFGSLSISGTSQTLIGANSARTGLLLYNGGNQIAYLFFGVTASPTQFTVVMYPGDYYELPMPVYSGRIDVIWASAGTGAMYRTELQA